MSDNPNAGTGEKLQKPSSHWLDLLAFGVWCGIVTGLLEFAKRHRGGWYIGDTLLNLKAESAWMMPAANAVLFAGVALALLVLRFLFPRVVTLRACIGTFLCLLFLNVLLTSHRIYPVAWFVFSIGLATVALRILFARKDSIMGFLARPALWFLGLRRKDAPAESPSEERDSELQESEVTINRRQLLATSALCLAGPALGSSLWRSNQGANAPALTNPSRPDLPNIVFLVLDTVRATNLGLYGYDRDTAPNLSRLAASGVTFDRAIAAAPWTLTSHASMFTGRYPLELSCGWAGALDDAHPTLAEELAQRGYATGGFVANALYCDRRFGLARGFHRYEDAFWQTSLSLHHSTLARKIGTSALYRIATKSHDLSGRAYADLINDRLLRWIRGLDHRPFFAFLNYFDAHGPYVPPAPFDSKFGPARKRSDLPLEFRIQKPRDGYELTPQELELEISQYDGTIAYLDQEIGKLLDALEEMGELENTIMVVVADHGEEFGEHGVYDHGNSLYIQGLHVPLIMSNPGRIPSGKRVARPLSLRDIGATLLDLVGEHDPAAFPGTPYSRFWSGKDTDGTDVPLLSFVNKAEFNPEWYPVSRGNMQSVCLGSHHFIRNGDGQEELYDLSVDLMEEKDLIGSPESLPIASECRRHLDEYQATLEEEGRLRT